MRQTDNEDLEQRVERLEDIQRVKAAIQRYVRAHDAHESELLRSVFADDACIDVDGWGQTQGVDEIVQLYEDIWHDDVFTNHHLTNQVIRVEQDRAVASSYMLVMIERVDDRPMHYSGYYVRELEKRNGAWVHGYLRVATQYRSALDAPSFQRDITEDTEIPHPQDHPDFPLPLFPRSRD